MSEMTKLDFNAAIKDCKVSCCNALRCLYCYAFAVKCLKLFFCVESSYNRYQCRIYKCGVDTNVGLRLGLWPLFPFTFTFCYLAMPRFSECGDSSCRGGTIAPVWTRAKSGAAHCVIWVFHFTWRCYKLIVLSTCCYVFVCCWHWESFAVAGYRYMVVDVY